MRWLLLFVLAACSSSHERVAYPIVSPARDWTAHPAVVEVDGPKTIYALSDVHGGYDRMVALLQANHVIAAGHWTADSSVLVVTGDLMDKGPAPIEAIDLLRTLETEAPNAGGRVIFTLGNHEAEFLYDPENDKATKDDGVDVEIHARGLTPVAFANGSEVHGQWLRERPFAARVGSWFFAHAGNTHGRSIPEIEMAIRSGITANDYADKEAIAGDSILEAREWYDASTIGATVAAVNAKHIVFGHQPDALGPRGEIAVAFGGALFRIDCGMSPNIDDSHGRLMKIHQEGSAEIAESLGPDGTAHEIWRGP